MGLADARLHAHAFPRTARQEDFETVAEFFRAQPFARIGAIISTKATRDESLSPVATIAGVLKNRIVKIASTESSLSSLGKPGAKPMRRRIRKPQIRRN
jgi:hypothetical protein